MDFKKLRILLLLTGLFIFNANAQQQQQQVLKVTRLRCDLLVYSDLQVNRNGYLTSADLNANNFSKTIAARISNKRPTFGWEIESDKKAFLQTAFRLIISSSQQKLIAEEGDIWDSEKVSSHKSTAIPYNGTIDLIPNTLYFWKVMVWDNNESSSFSEPGVFLTDSSLVEHATSRYPLLKIDQAAKEISSSDMGSYFIDFGKASFGQLKLTINNKHCYPLDSIKVSLGEVRDGSGANRLNPSPGGSRRYREVYLKVKPGEHTYFVDIKPDKGNTASNSILMPEYIGEVLPFRYVELIGMKDCELKNVTRLTVIYPFNDHASHFKSSDSVLNKIWELSKYSIKATNFAGVYVDGDRERIPYEADVYINQLSHYGVDDEFSIARYSHEYLIKNANWPTEWILQSVLIARNDLLYTGDTRSISHFYDMLKAKTLMHLEDENGLISTRKGKQSKAFLNSINFKGKELRDIVDWPHAGILGLGKDDPGETDGFVFNDFNSVINAFYFKALNDMAEIARALLKNEEVDFFVAKAKQVKSSYNNTFLDKTKKIYKDGDQTDHSSLHANMFALAFGLVEPENVPYVTSFIKQRGMVCSVYGSQFLLDAVYSADMGDYGLSLLTAKGERSWYNMIEAGSTITMEAWGNKYKPNQDWNHAWGAAPANIIPRRLMGVEPKVAGWEYFQIKPQIGNLTHATLRLPTIKGQVLVDYSQTPGSFTMKVTIPANTKADIFVPLRKEGKPQMLLNGKKIKLDRSDNSWHLIHGVGSGQYIIEIKYLPFTGR